MEYQVTVTETLSRVVNIDSTSAKEAEEKVRSLYKQEAIVLDWADFADLNIKVNAKAKGGFKEECTGSELNSSNYLILHINDFIAKIKSEY